MASKQVGSLRFSTRQGVTTDFEPCGGCGALFLRREGPTHHYIGASAGCWALYTQTLAGNAIPAEVATSRVPPPTTQPVTVTLDVRPELRVLLVDAYAAQHHGTPSPQATQSVAVHLLALYGVCRRRMSVEQALWIRRRAVRRRGVFRWLEPPPSGVAFTLRHLFPGGGVERPLSESTYVISVLESWERAHGDNLGDWYDRFVLSG